MNAPTPAETDEITRLCGYPNGAAEPLLALQAMPPDRLATVRAMLPGLRNHERLIQTEDRLFNDDRAALCQVVQVPNGPNVRARSAVG